jgi:hypothetical protein
MLLDKRKFKKDVKVIIPEISDDAVLNLFYLVEHYITGALVNERLKNLKESKPSKQTLLED